MSKNIMERQEGKAKLSLVISALLLAGAVALAILGWMRMQAGKDKEAVAWDGQTYNAGEYVSVDYDYIASYATLTQKRAKTNYYMLFNEGVYIGLEVPQSMIATYEKQEEDAMNNDNFSSNVKGWIRKLDDEDIKGYGAELLNIFHESAATGLTVSETDPELQWVVSLRDLGSANTMFFIFAGILGVIGVLLLVSYFSRMSSVNRGKETLSQYGIEDFAVIDQQASYRLPERGLTIYRDLLISETGSIKIFDLNKVKFMDTEVVRSGKSTLFYLVVEPYEGKTQRVNLNGTVQRSRELSTQLLDYVRQNYPQIEIPVPHL